MVQGISKLLSYSTNQEKMSVIYTKFLIEEHSLPRFLFPLFEATNMLKNYKNLINVFTIKKI